MLVIWVGQNFNRDHHTNVKRNLENSTYIITPVIHIFMYTLANMETLTNMQNSTLSKQLR